MRLLEFIAIQGRITKAQLTQEFNLPETNVLRPLLAVLNNRGLIRQGSGYYPTAKLNRLCRILTTITTFTMGKKDTPHNKKAESTQKKLEGGIYSEGGKHGKHGKTAEEGA